jgi:hypothetical protein
VNSYLWFGGGPKKEFKSLTKEEQDNSVDFADLLEKVAEAASEMRIRYSTSHPRDINEKVVETMARHKNICNYIHLPVQSGNTRVLEAMSRNYSREWYMEKIDMIRRIIPDCGISSDIIAGFCTDAVNVNVGGSFSISIDQVGTGAQLNFVSDGDLLETSIKKLDEKLAELSQSIPRKAYEETITIIAGPTNGLAEVNELEAVSGSELQIPLDSRNSNLVKSYTVSSGQLEVFLNGQYLTLEEDWEEVGVTQEESITIKLLRDMQDGDVLSVRIDNTSFSGSGGGGGSYGEANTASNVGGGFSLFKNKIGVDLKFRTLVAGAGVSISQSSDVVSISSTPTAALLNVVTINGTNYNILPSNDVILVSNLGMLVSVYLPSASANPGKRFDIKKTDSGSIIRIRGQSGDTLDDINLFTSSLDISIQYESVTVVSNGVAWFII